MREALSDSRVAEVSVRTPGGLHETNPTEPDSMTTERSVGLTVPPEELTSTPVELTHAFRLHTLDSTSRQTRRNRM